jgi:hypothetical protein
MQSRPPPIPKGLRLKAQGCPAKRELPWGHRHQTRSQPQRGCASLPSDGGSEAGQSCCIAIWQPADGSEFQGIGLAHRGFKYPSEPTGKNIPSTPLTTFFKLLISGMPMWRDCRCTGLKILSGAFSRGLSPFQENFSFPRGHWHKMCFLARHRLTLETSRSGTISGTTENR